jgi:5'-phosphate synthase pdxT subunit
MIEMCGARGIGIKRPSGLNDVNGLIIPGGESTTIGKLIEEYGFTGEIRRLAEGGIPIFGTCAGLIVMARHTRGRHGPLLELVDITVDRNAFGRQVDSFEIDIAVEGIDDPDRPFHAVFIRAPLIEEIGRGVEVLARLREGAVMARERNFLVGAFHPELTGDPRIHGYFLDMVTDSVCRGTEV